MTTSRLGREIAARAALDAAKSECGRVQEGSDATHGTAPGPQLSPDPVPDLAPSLATPADEITELVLIPDPETVPPDCW